MDLRLFFIELPQAGTLELLDRRLSALARRQEPIDSGRRLWVTHVPETASRPFMNARPFDVLVMPVRLSNSESEDFKIGIGAAPKRCMICRAHDEDFSTTEVLFAIAAEILSPSGALLEITEQVGRKMFDIDEREDEFPAACLDGFPGAIYEIAHETDDGELATVWLVDARWLRAWINRKFQQNRAKSPEISRFSSLDYA